MEFQPMFNFVGGAILVAVGPLATRPCLLRNNHGHD